MNTRSPATTLETSRPSTRAPTGNNENTESDLEPPLASLSLSTKGRYFVVTGGTQGLGLAIAIQLKKAGAAGLFLVARSPDKGQAAVEHLRQQHQLGDDGKSTCQVFFLPTDLSDTKQVQTVFSRIEDLLSTTDVVSGLVNAAAITARGNLFTTTSNEFDTQFFVNVRAPFLLTQALAVHCRKQQTQRTSQVRASIVNISSVAAYGGAPFITAYSASKAALSTLTKTNAAELAPHGIRVNAIQLGWTYTDNEDALQTAQSDRDWIQRADEGVPLGRILRPHDVAVTVVFLLSEASAMTTGTLVDLHPEYAHGLISLAPTDAR
jgi:NAD(P)-dependent dehydrogenase (short-subunit alcohol dehydrogenase family)|uniref:Ketoreductase domain-containing protein n=1 Tax=Phaeodactylum tricornutum TaxID=2850 RepID=A0A8J9TMW8_PHATR